VESCDIILKFLHDSGVVFYQKEYFNGQIILNQEWAISAIYKILNKDSDYFEILSDEDNKGILDYSLFKEVWVDNSEKEIELFLEFMLSCELSFEITPNKRWDTPLIDRQFIIPQLLPGKPPHIEAYSLEKHEINLIKPIEFSFLPSSFIQQFIVRSHQFARVEDIWQNGILLYYEKENSYAIVEAEHNQSDPNNITLLSSRIIVQHTRNCDELLKAIFTELDNISCKAGLKPIKFCGPEAELEIAHLKSLNGMVDLTLPDGKIHDVIRREFRVKLKNLLHKEYKNLFRHNELLNDAKDPKIRIEHEEEIRRREENIRRINSKFQIDLDNAKPPISDSTLEKLVEEIKLEIFQYIKGEYLENK